MLDMVMEILPSPMDTEAIEGHNPDTEEKNQESHLLMSHLLL